MGRYYKIALPILAVCGVVLAYTCFFRSPFPARTYAEQSPASALVFDEKLHSNEIKVDTLVTLFKNAYGGKCTVFPASGKQTIVISGAGAKWMDLLNNNKHLSSAKSEKFIIQHNDGKDETTLIFKTHTQKKILYATVPYDILYALARKNATPVTHTSN